MTPRTAETLKRLDRQHELFVTALNRKDSYSLYKEAADEIRLLVAEMENETTRERIQT